jgi:UDP-glucose 4-epimerase
LPIDELHLTNPTNPYGRNKSQIEELLRDVSNSDPEWAICALRYFNPVGAHESGLIGEDPKGIPNNLMPYVAQVASGKLPFLKVFGDDYDTEDGTGVRDYIHVMDLANGHLAALVYLSKNKGFDIFNLGTGNGVSVFEIVKAYEKVCGHAIDMRVTDRRIGDIAKCYASAEKAHKALLWIASRDINDMCQDLFRWQKKGN